MTLTKKGKYYYGDSQSDIQAEISRYSALNGYLANNFRDAICDCGGHLFNLSVDDDEGAAIRCCTSCGKEHPIGDSQEYLENANPYERECVCGSKVFEITAGVSLYTDSEDVRWLYLGCRCPRCGLTGCYGDWKSEYTDYHDLLDKI